MRLWKTLTACLLVFQLGAQPRVLHFTRTSGFDHNTRVVSYAMFTDIATMLGAVVDDDATGDPFDDPATLATYDAIVFSNTSGDAILDPLQRSHFEQWVALGGHVMGIHAATDTYRHGSANGNNTGTWDFYAELLGASVQENPNHVNGTPPYALQHIGVHPSTSGLPAPWVKNEEYYYWEGGYFGPDNVEVLRVEETLGPNGLVNSYDAPRPMSWYRELPGGTRVFYTALGHAADNYTSDPLFRAHIRDALQWLLDGTTGLGGPLGPSDIDAFPNPASEVLYARVGGDRLGDAMTLHDTTGRVVLEQRANTTVMTLHVLALPPGCYFLRIGAETRKVQIVR